MTADDPSARASTSGVEPAILVVDDTEAKRLSIRAVLTSLGHEIVEAESGQDALRYLLKRQFAVIVMDVRMPLMNGFETAALVRQRQKSESTPILFVTEYALPDDARVSPPVAGASDFITMPVNPHELRAKVAGFVKVFVDAQPVRPPFRPAPLGADSWRALADRVPIGVFRTDDELRILYVNAEWTRLTGLEASEANGLVPHELFGVAAPEQAGRGASRPDLHQEFRRTMPGGREGRLRMVSRHLPDDGPGPAGWVGTLTGILPDAAVG